MDSKKAHERVISRSLLVGGVVGGFGGLAGAISALWNQQPFVFRNALFTGTTLLAFSSGSIFFAELFRESQRNGQASLLDTFTSGTLWGLIVGRGSLGIRGRQLIGTGLYLGCAASVIDYCMLKLVTPNRLKAIEKNDEKSLTVTTSPDSEINHWFKWLPVIGQRAKRIEELHKEIELLEK